MKYIDEFRSRSAVGALSRRIFEIMPSRAVRLMEVCGTHTQSFHRFGLDALIPDNLYLIAGPGCPVCVSDQSYIDKAIYCSRLKDTIILIAQKKMLQKPLTKIEIRKIEREITGEQSQIKVKRRGKEAEDLNEAMKNK